MPYQVHLTQMKICFKLYFENATALSEFRAYIAQSTIAYLRVI